MTPTEWINSQYLFDVVETGYALVTTSTQIAIANPSRVCIIISNGNTGGCLVSTQSTNSSTQGLYLQGSELPYSMKAADVGSLVTKDLFAVGVGIGAVITVIEVLFKDR